MADQYNIYDAKTQLSKLVAQARCEGLTLVTADRRLALYDVPILPATD